MKERDREAQRKHRDWLLHRGLHISQLKKKRTKGVIKIPDYGPSSVADASEMQEKMRGVGAVNSIWEKIRRGEEKQETVEAIQQKAKRVAPAYNKGPTMFINEKDDPTSLGRK